MGYPSPWRGMGTPSPWRGYIMDTPTPQGRGYKMVVRRGTPLGRGVCSPKGLHVVVEPTLGTPSPSSYRGRFVGYWVFLVGATTAFQ